MGLITNILFPVDFSPSCIAMGAYVKRMASLLEAKVSLIYVFNPASASGMELAIRDPAMVEEEHTEIAREKLDSFLRAVFPLSDAPRILSTGDPSTQITRTAKQGNFDLIAMPTHAGTFRRMLLGSTVAKVLNDADCMVATSRHAETIAPRPLEHREWLCVIGLGEDSERVLRLANQASEEAHAHLRIIHAIQSPDPSLAIQMDVVEKMQLEEKQRVRERIDVLQRKVGSRASVRIAIGSIKEALLEAAVQSDVDALIIGRSPHSGTQGRLRDLTYAIVRDSPFPVISV